MATKRATAVKPARVDHVELYRDMAGDWRWCAKARNGRILADSGEGYKRPGHCRSALEGVVNAAARGIPIRVRE